MRFRIIVISIIISFNWALAAQYDNYNVVPIDSSLLQKITDSLSTLNLIPLNAKNSGNASLFGANQILVNSDFTSIVSFKYDVKGDFKLNQWEYLNNGQVYHYSDGNKVNALFFYGINEESANRVIEKVKNIEISSTIIRSFLIEGAFASECDPSRQQKIEYPTFEKITSSVIFKSLLSCASGAQTGAYDSTLGLGEMAWTGLKSVGSEMRDVWTNPQQKFDQYYNGVVRGSLALKDIFTFATEMIVNPDLAKATLNQKYGESSKKIITLFEHIKNLPTPLMVEMTCSLITGIGIDVLVTYLTAGAGAEKLGITFLRLNEKFETVGKIFKALDNVYDKSKGILILSKEKMEIFTRNLLQNKIPEADLEYLNNILGKSKNTDSTVIEAMSCYIK